MCVGEKRRLIVPPQLGHGDQGAGDIVPGGATLFFEIELLDTENEPACKYRGLYGTEMNKLLNCT